MQLFACHNCDEGTIELEPRVVGDRVSAELRGECDNCGAELSVHESELDWYMDEDSGRDR